jgi:hypothetical protein
VGSRMDRGSGATIGMAEVEPQGQHHLHQHCQCGRSNAYPTAEAARSSPTSPLTGLR